MMLVAATAGMTFADNTPISHVKVIQAAEDAYRRTLIEALLTPPGLLDDHDRAARPGWVETLCSPRGPFTPLEVAWGLFYGVSAISTSENPDGYDVVISNIVRLAVQTCTRSRPAQAELPFVGPRWLYEVEGLSRQYSAFNGRIVGPFDNAEDERICREAEEEYLRRQQEWIENAGAHKQHRETVLRLTRTLHQFAKRLPPPLRAKLLDDLRSHPDTETDFIEIFGLAEFVTADDQASAPGVGVDPDSESHLSDEDGVL